MQVSNETQRILVVEDSGDVALALSLWLRSNGYEVQVARDGHAALAAADEFKPQAVILDVGLPGISGLEVARHLRTTCPTLTIIALTGRAEPEDVQACFDAGCNKYLIKPANPQLLLTLLPPREPAPTQ